MAITRWNPMRDLTSLSGDFAAMQREINRMFENYLQGGTTDDSTFGPTIWTPAVDILEKEDEYLVKVELPGVNKDDVKITLESNILTVKGEKHQEQEEKNQSYHRLERTHGSFQRSFTLPTTVRNDKIDATFKDGVLSVVLPKAEESKPRTIEVKVK
jgi:HSP20 family protein